MAVRGALRAGRGGFRAVRATERRQVGRGAALDGQRVVVGCGISRLKKLGGTACATPPYKARGLFYRERKPGQKRFRTPAP